MRCDGGKKLGFIAVVLTAVVAELGLGPLATASAQDNPPVFADDSCSAGVVGTIDLSADATDPAYAIVASCAPAAPSDGALPETGSSTGGLLIGSAMVLAGVAASLASRRRI